MPRPIASGSRDSGACACGCLVTSAGCHGDGVATNPSGATGAAGTTPSATSPETADVVVHADDDGKTLDVPLGGTVTFRLVGHTGTGYVWLPAPMDGGVLGQVGERTSEVSSDTPGAPKVDIYRFAAQSAGTATVEMDLKRPWGDQPPVRTTRVTVKVR